MGQCLKICEDFCQKMAESTAISGQTISILMLDEFSRRGKMHLEQRAKPSELFLEDIVVSR